MASWQQGAGAAERDGPFGEERLASIAAGLADQFALLYEARPADPQAHMAGNMLAIAFRGGLSVSDEKHLAAGHDDELRAFRERFMEVVADELKSVVESFSGGHVRFFSSAFDPVSRTTNMLFVLDLLPDDRDEQRSAIRNWSEQVRRNARELRISHLQTRETHIALREQMGELRVAHREGEPDQRGEGRNGDSEEG
jgi:uncharacterized protein YbcI